MRAAEAEDVCFAHSAGSEASLGWGFRGCVFDEVPGLLMEGVKLGPINWKGRVVLVVSHIEDRKQSPSKRTSFKRRVIQCVV